MEPVDSVRVKAGDMRRNRWVVAETLPTSYQMFRRAVKPILLERMDGSPASADNSLWVCARTATGVQPAIELAAGGMGKQGCCEVNDPTLRSATRDMKREKKKSSVVKNLQVAVDFRRPRPTSTSRKKVVTRK